MTATKLVVSRKALLDAMEQVEKIADETMHWSAVRVNPKGEVYVTEEVSRCFGVDEYYGNFPHTVTVYERQGDGQCNIDWDNEDAEVRSNLWDLVDGIEEKLTEAGYEVEIIKA